MLCRQAQGNNAVKPCLPSVRLQVAQAATGRLTSLGGSVCSTYVYAQPTKLKLHDCVSSS